MIEQKISHGNFPISYSHIREGFDFLQNWEERYHFITELGTKIPTYPPEFRIDQSVSYTHLTLPTTPYV